jgi:hypothetical protein
MIGRYPIAVLPFPALSPSACEALVAAIDDALEAFSRWNLPTGPNTKLQKARVLLSKVAEKQTYGTTGAELLDTAQAIRLANDFYVISRMLPESRENVIAEELREALLGALNENPSKHKKEFDIQSQLWIGTVLAHSGLHPAMPNSRNTKPDFVISLGTLMCGLEVKRPRTEMSAHRAVRAAADQLYKFRKPGVIVLDLTRCVGADELILHSGTPTTREIVDYRFDSVANALLDNIDQFSQSVKFGRVILFVVYARFFNWTIGSSQDLDTGFFFKSQPITGGYEGLLSDEAARIQKLMAEGFKRISGNRLSLKRTSSYG